ncbi:MAG: hypothetical protein LBK99_01605 [Opitutaceae bacterium]|jgi:ABC-type amino acid transport system permease subunit|nr:hypothetical protein [Opitutaceae bacterium]
MSADNTPNEQAEPAEPAKPAEQAEQIRITGIAIPMRPGPGRPKNNLLKILAFVFYFAVPVAFLGFAAFVLWLVRDTPLLVIVVLQFLAVLGWIFRPALRETKPDEPRNVSGFSLKNLFSD